MPRRQPVQNDKPGVKTVENALELLDHFIRARTELAADEVAELFSMSLITINRYLQTLASNGYLEYDERRGTYRLGLRFLEAGATVTMQSRLRRIALSYLTSLAEQLDACVSIGVADGYRVVLVDRVMPPWLHGAFSPAGGVADWHASAAGKAIAAYQPPAILEDYLRQGPFTVYTPNTIADPEALRSHFAEIRQQGWARDLCETRNNVYCIAAPIFEQEGTVNATLSIATINQEFLAPEGLEGRIKALKLAVSRISGVLGYV